MLSIRTLIVLLLTFLFAPPVYATLQVGVTMYDLANPANFYSNVFVDEGNGTAGAVVNLLGPAPGLNCLPLCLRLASTGSVYHSSSSLSEWPFDQFASSVQVTAIPGTSYRVYVAASVTDAPVYSPSYLPTSGGGSFYGVGAKAAALTYYYDVSNRQGAAGAFADYGDFLAGYAAWTPGDIIASFTETSTGFKGFKDFGFPEEYFVINSANPYSLTMLHDLTITYGSIWSNGSIDIRVPEPSATLFLLGTGLAGLGGFAWWRHRN